WHCLAMKSQGEKSLTIGAHVSTAGGLENAIPEAISLNATCAQIFTANQRQWQPKTPDAETIARFRAAREKSPLVTIMSHANYLLNICSPKADVQEKSVAGLKREIERC